MGIGLLERAGRCHVMGRGGMEKGLHPAVPSLQDFPLFPGPRPVGQMHAQIGESCIRFVFPSVHLHLLYFTRI